MENINQSLTKIAQYLASQKALTLCCADDDGPYCCNCFYVFDQQNIAFYITSQLSTHHAGIILTSPKVAGTVHAQPASIAKIKGIQYQGTIKLLEGDEEKQARRLFCEAYPIAKLKQAPMWGIYVDRFKMTDNTLGFAKKILWSRYD